MMVADPSYLALREQGYAFQSAGAMLGDRRRDPSVTWYNVTAPGGAPIGTCRGISAALQIARKHCEQRAP
jgi:hypothetical protein